MNTHYLWLSPDRFEELVEEALDEIPDTLWNMIDNVGIVVEDWPSPAQLASVNIKHATQLLGLYQGIPVTKRDTHYGLIAPDKISLFRGPILMMTFQNEDAVREQVRRTVLHEIAHFFGISDQRLRELGAY